MKKFKNKTEAEEYVRSWVPSCHCPLMMNEPCSTKCVCFVPPRFTQRQTNDRDGTLEYVCEDYKDVGYCSAYCLQGPNS